MSDFEDGSVPETTERREAARAKANQLRLQHRKQERRGRALLKVVIAVVVVAIIAVVAVAIISAIRPPSPGPLNMLSDGIQVGKGGVAKHTSAIQPNGQPVANVAAQGTIAIDVYVDYFEPASKDFTTANIDQIKVWVDSGAATVEFHPISLLNNRSQGTQYSSRAANAAACVANFAPDSFLAFNSALLAAQPDETTSGLTDAQLVDAVKASGATGLGSIQSCITDQTFKAWVKDATDRALAGPIPNSKLDKITVTPTVLLNGLMYPGVAGDRQAFSAFFLQVNGSSFNQDSTATPTPVPTAP